MTDPRRAGRIATLVACFAALAWIGGGSTAGAEVYLAVTEGYRCSQCHVNRTGGGMRTEFASVWAQTNLPFWVPEREGGDDALGKLLRTGQAGPVRMGADLRAVYEGTFGSGDRDDTNEFELDEANLYLEATLLDERVYLYADESFAPGGANNREAFGMLSLPLGKEGDGRWWLKAGKFFQPFGLRQLDDETLTRGATGFSFTNSDEGIEVGFEPGDWQIALAVTNGNQGGPEDNDQKQFSLFSEYVQPRWRLGASTSFNHGDQLDREAFGIHGGFRVGKLVMLGEVDLVQDSFAEATGRGDEERLAGLVETRFWVGRGQNLRLTWDSWDPDRDIATNTRERFTVGYEGFLAPNVQLRGNAIIRRAPPQFPERRDDTVAVELHLFF